MGEATVDEFMRHLQAELSDAERLIDLEERDQRTWQIEAAIQEAIVFLNRWRAIEAVGTDPLKIVEEEIIIRKAAISEKTYDRRFCESCGEATEADIDFCIVCGKKH